MTKPKITTMRSPAGGSSKKRRYELAGIRTAYDSGITPRELRARHKVSFEKVRADIGERLWTNINGRRTTRPADRPTVMERITDPAQRRALAMIAKRDHLAGMPISQLSAELELTADTVSGLIDELDREIVAAYERGASIERLAEKFEIVPRRAARKWLTSAGGTVRKTSSGITARSDRPTRADNPMRFAVDTTLIERFARATGATLREERDAQGLLRRHVAPELGVSPQAVATHESGSRDLTISNLLRYCAVYGVSPADIMAKAYAQIFDTPPEGVAILDLAELAVTPDPRLAPLRTWAAARLKHAKSSRDRVVRLDDITIRPVAARCGLTPAELLDIIATSEQAAPGEEEALQLHIDEPPPGRHLYSVG